MGWANINKGTGNMIATAATYAEALKIAEDFRAIFAGCDWIVCIAASLFEGDTYFITVG